MNSPRVLGAVFLLFVIGMWSAQSTASNVLWEDHFDQAQGIDFAKSVDGNRRTLFIAGAVDSDFVIRAYNKKTGKLLWMDRVGGAAEDFEYARAIAASNQYVLAAGTINDGAGDSFTVRAYNAKSGKLLWKDQSIIGGSANAISLRRERVFVAGAISNGSGEEFAVRAYDSRTGSLIWEERVRGEKGSARAIKVTNKRVFVAGNSGEGDVFYPQDFAVRAYEARTGKLVWADKVSGTATNVIETAFDIAVEGDMVYAAGFLKNISSGADFTVRAYHAETGILRWEDQVAGKGEWSDDTDLAYAVAASRGRVFVAGRIAQDHRTGDFLVRAYDAVTGALLWVDQTDGALTQVDDEAVAIGVSGDRVFVAGAVCDDPETLSACGDFTVRAYDAAKGNLLWKDVAIGTAHATDIVHALIIQDNRVFAVGQIVDDAGGRDFFVRAYRAK